MNAPKLTSKRLSTQILLALAFTVLLIVVLQNLLLGHYGQALLDRQLEKRMEHSLDLMAIGIAPDVKINIPDIPKLRNFAQKSFKRDDDLLSLRILDRKRKEILSLERDEIPTKVDRHTLQLNIAQAGETFGALEADWDRLAPRQEMGKTMRLVSLLGALLLGLMLFMLWFWIRILVLRPVSHINAHLDRLTEGDLDTPLEISASAELERLGQSANSLQKHMKLSKERQQELGVAQQHLQASYAELERARDEALEVSRMKSEFLANMSHELRTPLNAVLGMSEALREGVYGELAPESDMPLEQIEDSGRHLLGLINDILDLSKIEADQFSLEKEIIHVETSARESMQFVRNMAQKKRITLSISIDQRIFGFQADARRFKQVLINLLSNAVKFTDHGGEVSLEVVGYEDKGEVAVTVTDNGIGISKENLDKVFQSFVQIEGNIERSHDGSGLGLSLVKSMVEMHEGRVSVQSEVGVGSTFTAIFPWDPKAESQRVEVFSPSEEATPAAAFNTALNIEDSPIAAQQITRYLDELDIKNVVHPKATGALARVAEVKPDVIILDIMLPDDSGWNVLKSLKENPETADIPVIVVSVVDDAMGHEGMAAHLVKPIARDQLQNALQMINPSDDHDIRSALSLMTDLQSRGSSPSPEGSVGTILLVEDNEANVKTLYGYLNAQGYHIVLATNGVEALERLEEQVPDIILMDIQMPIMGGFEAMERIRQREEWKRLPIIALTALAMKGDAERCIKSGASAYLAKPVRLKELGNTIRGFLDKKN